jgi:hypothetical protein
MIQPIYSLQCCPIKKIKCIEEGTWKKVIVAISGFSNTHYISNYYIIYSNYRDREKGKDLMCGKVQKSSLPIHLMQFNYMHMKRRILNQVYYSM